MLFSRTCFQPKMVLKAKFGNVCFLNILAMLVYQTIPKTSINHKPSNSRRSKLVQQPHIHFSILSTCLLLSFCLPLVHYPAIVTSVHQQWILNKDPIAFRCICFKECHLEVLQPKPSLSPRHLRRCSPPSCAWLKGIMESWISFEFFRKARSSLSVPASACRSIDVLGVFTPLN